MEPTKDLIEQWTQEAKECASEILGIPANEIPPDDTIFVTYLSACRTRWQEQQALKYEIADYSARILKCGLSHTKLKERVATLENLLREADELLRAVEDNRSKHVTDFRNRITAALPPPPADKI